MKNRILVIAVVLVAVFLAGFVPQFLRANRLGRELRRAQQMDAYAEIRDLSALAYVQANQKNYGLASETCARFFTRVAEIARQAEDENRRKALEGLLSTRDKITAELAKGDASATADIGDIFIRTRQAFAAPQTGSTPTP